MMPGFPEMAIVLMIVLLCFGAGKVPEVFGSMGEGVKRFREAQRDGENPFDATSDVTPKLAEPAAEVEEAQEVSSGARAES
jgi:TatA/E family protein of Tat protein translocase